MCELKDDLDYNNPSEMKLSL